MRGEPRLRARLRPGRSQSRRAPLSLALSRLESEAVRLHRPSRIRGFGLVLSLALGLGVPCGAAARGGYPDLFDSHDAGLQAGLDELLAGFPGFWDGMEKQELGFVLADVTDLKRPKVAWYNPQLMLYAASMPKIAIVYGAFVEHERGLLEFDDETRGQLVSMVKKSSNAAASAVLRKVGIQRLAEILQDERYGKLYDIDRGGGLWVGKAYDKSPVWKRDPLRHLSHGANSIQAARLYYGFLTETLVHGKHKPFLAEIFGEPGLNHKFVKGLKGRKDAAIYRKSGTWRNFHSDGAVVWREGVAYIAIALDTVPAAARGFVDGIQLIDDFMLERHGLAKPSGAVGPAER
jgi:beta-lactamase class A